MLANIPDSPTANAAADLARAAAPQFLLNHSYRTYLFGELVVTDDVDEEAAFVAAMIHDLGLTDEHQGTDDFAIVSAELAGRFLSERGWEPSRIGLVEQAILRHANLRPEDDPTHRVVQAGAALDVAGLGLGWISSDDLAAVLNAYPRSDFVPKMRAAFLDEVQRQPDGTFAKLERDTGLSERLAENPLDRY